jgi:hypothetical protein
LAKSRDCFRGDTRSSTTADGGSVNRQVVAPTAEDDGRCGIKKIEAYPTPVLAFAKTFLQSWLCRLASSSLCCFKFIHSLNIALPRSKNAPTVRQNIYTPIYHG